MSDNRSVPLTRELLEALRMTAADVALGHDGILSVHARRLADACAAALASDAGTPEGEPDPPLCYPLRGHHGPCRLSAAPDAELDRLLRTFADAQHDYLRAVGNGRAEYDAQEHARAAVHAHVAQVKREARAGRMRDMDVPTLHKVPKPEPAPAPAPGDASGETADNFEAALSEYVEAALDCAADDSNQPYERLRGRRELARQQVMRLYRATTGEVVATGTVTGRSWEGRPVPRFATVSLTVGDARRLPLGATVSVVRRREKEEG